MKDLAHIGEKRYSLADFFNAYWEAYLRAPKQTGKNYMKEITLSWLNYAGWLL